MYRTIDRRTAISVAAFLLSSILSSASLISPLLAGLWASQRFGQACERAELPCSQDAFSLILMDPAIFFVKMGLLVGTMFLQSFGMIGIAALQADRNQRIREEGEGRGAAIGLAIAIEVSTFFFYPVFLCFATTMWIQDVLFRSFDSTQHADDTVEAMKQIALEATGLYRKYSINVSIVVTAVVTGLVFLFLRLPEPVVLETTVRKTLSCLCCLWGGSGDRNDDRGDDSDDVLSNNTDGYSQEDDDIPQHRLV